MGLFSRIKNVIGEKRSESRDSARHEVAYQKHKHPTLTYLATGERVERDKAYAMREQMEAQRRRERRDMIVSKVQKVAGKVGSELQKEFKKPKPTRKPQPPSEYYTASKSFREFESQFRNPYAPKPIPKKIKKKEKGKRIIIEVR